MWHLIESDMMINNTINFRASVYINERSSNCIVTILRLSTIRHMSLYIYVIINTVVASYIFGNFLRASWNTWSQYPRGYIFHVCICYILIF